LNLYFRQWTKDSFAFYHELAHSPEASNAGVGVLDAYHFFIEGEEEKACQMNADKLNNNNEFNMKLHEGRLGPTWKHCDRL